MSDLNQFASDHKIPLSRIDFDLISYETYFKGTVDDEWQLLHGKKLFEETTEIELRSSFFLLRQEYQINIREASPHPMLDLYFTIASDKYKSRTVAIIDPKSVIPLKKGVQEWIKESIIRKQLRNGLMIEIFDRSLDQQINRLLIKIQKEGPLSEAYRLPLSEALPPIPPINDSIILHYKQNKKENSLIEGVQPDDLILEYIFPQNGRDGRGCDGQYIMIPEPEVKYKEYLLIDEQAIKSEEDLHSIRFYAKISGFMQRRKGKFTIAQELQIDSASFKKTGSIETGIDKDISLKVKSKISNEDSIGSGVSIDVQKLDVNGTIGGNTKIQACEVTIGAQTHKKSEINVTEIANIHLHRGNLKAKEANIDILEAGKIEADIVRIKQMVGGEIIARTVHIDVLYSNARIIALESITIDQINGEGNNLIIDPQSVNAYHENIAELEMDIRDKTSRLQEHSKEFITRQISFKEKNARIKQFQQRVMDAQKNGVEPLKADTVRVQQYKIEAEALKRTADQLREEDSLLHTLKEQLTKLYNADLHAVITNHSHYSGHDRIIFIDPKTHQEYAISPEGKTTHIRLRQVGDEKKLLLES